MVYYMFAVLLLAAPQVFADENHIESCLELFKPEVFADENHIESCLELFKPELMTKGCCESMDMIKELEACAPKEGEWECENSKCLLENAGLLSGDVIDEDRALKVIENKKKESPNDKAMYERVQTECLKGKYDDYPPKEACPFIRFHICSYVNSMMECPSWKQDDTCKKMADHAKVCKSVLDNIKTK